MKLMFTQKQKITTVFQLNTIQKQQLEKAGEKYDGKFHSVAERLQQPNEYDYADPSFAGMCHHYKIMEGNTHIYDAWLYKQDSGTFFKAHTTEIIGEIVQFSPNILDKDLQNSIGMAMVEANLLPKKDSAYKKFKKMLEKRE